MIIIEGAKEFFCLGCGSKLGVIASDIEVLKASSENEKDRKYFTCPLCQHTNFLAKEDAPTITNRLMSDVKVYTQPD